jgi:hypothetical protein
VRVEDGVRGALYQLTKLDDDLTNAVINVAERFAARTGMRGSFGEPVQGIIAHLQSTSFEVDNPGIAEALFRFGSWDEKRQADFINRIISHQEEEREAKARVRRATRR